MVNRETLSEHRSALSATTVNFSGICLFLSPLYDSKFNHLTIVDFIFSISKLSPAQTQHGQVRWLETATNSIINTAVSLTIS